MWQRRQRSWQSLWQWRSRITWKQRQGQWSENKLLLTCQSNKLSFEEHDKICKERDKKGEQGGTKQLVGDLSIKQFAAMISSVKQDTATATTTNSTDTSNPGNNAGNVFGGKEGAEQIKFS
jgi:hypothetical protein